MEVHILGKSNNMIPLLLDAYYENHKTPSKVNIVLNIPVGEKPLYKLEKIGVFDFCQIENNNWDGSYKRLLLGVIRVPTKRAVFNAFTETHGIQRTDYYTLFHPSAIISTQSDIGSGVFIGPGSIISPYVRLGNIVTINRKVSVGHHTEIGEFATLNPGCNIAGGSEIGAFSTIGMGANIFDGVNVGKNSIIGAGSVVTKDIPDNVVVFGIPAKIVRENDI